MPYPKTGDSDICSNSVGRDSADISPSASRKFPLHEPSLNTVEGSKCNLFDSDDVSRNGDNEISETGAVPFRQSKSAGEDYDATLRNSPVNQRYLAAVMEAKGGHRHEKQKSPLNNHSQHIGYDDYVKTSNMASFNPAMRNNDSTTGYSRSDTV